MEWQCQECPNATEGSKCYRISSCKPRVVDSVEQKLGVGIILSQAEHEQGLPFRVLLVDAKAKLKMSQKQLAEALDFTPQYICDLEMGRRLGSVEFVERMCKLLQCKQPTRLKWHRAAARAHGWDV